MLEALYRSPGLTPHGRAVDFSMPLLQKSIWNSRIFRVSWTEGGRETYCEVHTGLGPSARHMPNAEFRLARGGIDEWIRRG
jgi:hypothetical protein